MTFQQQTVLVLALVSTAAGLRCATSRLPRIRATASPRASASSVEDEAPCLQLVHMQSPAALGARFWSEVLMESGALYVSLSDAAEGTDAEEPIFAAHAPDGGAAQLEKWEELLEARHLWGNTTMEVGFSVGADVEATLLLAAASAGLDALPRFRIEDLAPRDWVTAVQSSWPPVEIPGCLFIRFPWHPPAAEVAGASGLDVLTLHPGMAFGTGEHATTQLCCEALRSELARPELRGCEMLDYGSGSGVLAFAALRFGAARSVGVEIDPEALATSRLNSEENGLADRFEGLLPAQEAEGAQFPLAVANILAGTLVQLRPVLARRVAPGGVLLLSGIWGDEQAAQVRAAYTAASGEGGGDEGGGDDGGGGFAFKEEARSPDGWFCIRLTRV